jgi:hypothetical protein
LFTLRGFGAALLHVDGEVLVLWKGEGQKARHISSDTVTREKRRWRQSLRNAWLNRCNEKKIYTSI